MERRFVLTGISQTPQSSKSHTKCISRSISATKKLPHASKYFLKQNFLTEVSPNVARGYKSPSKSCTLTPLKRIVKTEDEKSASVLIENLYSTNSPTHVKSPSIFLPHFILPEKKLSEDNDLAFMLSPKRRRIDIQVGSLVESMLKSVKRRRSEDAFDRQLKSDNVIPLHPLLVMHTEHNKYYTKCTCIDYKEDEFSMLLADDVLRPISIYLPSHQVLLGSLLRVISWKSCGEDDAYFANSYLLEKSPSNVTEKVKNMMKQVSQPKQSVIEFKETQKDEKLALIIHLKKNADRVFLIVKQNTDIFLVDCHQRLAPISFLGLAQMTTTVPYPFDNLVPIQKVSLNIWSDIIDENMAGKKATLYTIIENVV